MEIKTIGKELIHELNPSLYKMNLLAITSDHVFIADNKKILCYFIFKNDFSCDFEHQEALVFPVENSINHIISRRIRLKGSVEKDVIAYVGEGGLAEMQIFDLNPDRKSKNVQMKDENELISEEIVQKVIKFDNFGESTWSCDVNEKYFVCGSNGMYITMFDLETQERSVVFGVTHNVPCISLSVGSPFCMCSCIDGVARMFDMRSKSLICAEDFNAEVIKIDSNKKLEESEGSVLTSNNANIDPEFSQTKKKPKEWSWGCVLVKKSSFKRIRDENSFQKLNESQKIMSEVLEFINISIGSLRDSDFDKNNFIDERRLPSIIKSSEEKQKSTIFIQNQEKNKFHNNRILSELENTIYQKMEIENINSNIERQEKSIVKSEEKEIEYCIFTSKYHLYLMDEKMEMADKIYFNPKSISETFGMDLKGLRKVSFVKYIPTLSVVAVASPASNTVLFVRLVHLTYCNKCVMRVECVHVEDNSDPIIGLDISSPSFSPKSVFLRFLFLDKSISTYQLIDSDTFSVKKIDF